MKGFIVRKPFYATVLAVVVLSALFGAINVQAIGGQGAFTPPPPGSGGDQFAVPETKITEISDVFRIISGLFNIFFWLLIILAGVFIIWAAFNYLTSSGDPEKVKSANKQLIYAAVAVIVGVLARTLPDVVCNLITNGGCRVNPVTGVPET